VPDSSKSCSRIATFTASLAAISIDPKGSEEKSPSALRDAERGRGEEGEGGGSERAAIARRRAARRHGARRRRTPHAVAHRIEDAALHRAQLVEALRFPLHREEALRLGELRAELRDAEADETR
jgi:hypothetical protein